MNKDKKLPLKEYKDIPNEDFECNPKGDCWCKDIEFPPLPNSGSINPDICYSPREINEIMVKREIKKIENN